MRGNHRIWGRYEPPEPEVVSQVDRDRIKKLELRKNSLGYSDHIQAVFLDGRQIGLVRCNFGGQYFKPKRCRVWRLAGTKWGLGDPKFGLALVELLNYHEKVSA